MNLFKTIALASALILAPAIANDESLVPQQIELNVKNTVVLRGPVTDSSTTKAILAVYRLAFNRSKYLNTPIYLVLDSPGGSIFAGSALIESLKSVKNLHTITLFGASMAHAIAQAIPGSRYVLANSEMMAHRAKGRFGGQFESGEVESRLNHWKKIVRRMEQTNADRIGVPLKTYKKKVVNEWWESGTNLVTSGFADQLAEIKCSKDLIAQKNIIIVRGLFGNGAKRTFSGCPLLRSPID